MGASSQSVYLVTVWKGGGSRIALQVHLDIYEMWLAGWLVGGPEFEFERSFEYLHRLSLAGFYQDHPISDINPTKPDTWHCANLGITKYSRKKSKIIQRGFQVFKSNSCNLFCISMCSKEGWYLPCKNIEQTKYSPIT